MTGPSLRTVAVSAGFLGLTIVVAGAATAMTAQTSDEPVATAVTLEVAGEGTRADAELDSADPAPPATPVEVRQDPIECTPDGICGTADTETSTVAIDVTAEQTTREEQSRSTGDERRDERRADSARPGDRDAHRHEDERSARHDRDRAGQDRHGDGDGGRHDGRGEHPHWRTHDEHDGERDREPSPRWRDGDRERDWHAWGERGRHDRERG